ncbi:MAG: MATE family efflux transporter [Lachnotalea sp.]
MELMKIKQHRSRTILQFAIPSIVAMVLSSMISVIDGYYTGNYIGKEGLAAINLGLPIVYLYLAVGLMIAVGGISIAGRMLGAGKIKEANHIFRQTITLCVVVTLTLTAIFFFTLEPISKLVKADAVTRGYFIAYYRILIFELPLMVIISALGMFIRGEGSPLFVMLTNIVSVILNIILDYVMVGPLSLGIAGIAWASVISVVIVLIINMAYFIRSKVFKFGSFKWEGTSLKETFFNGASEFIGELSMCISMAAYNYIVFNYAGVDGLAAFTIIGYVSYVFSMIIVGFGQGIVPVISFSFGAGDHLLSRQVRNTTMKMLTVTAIIVFGIMTLLTGWYSGLFSDSSDVKDLVVPGLRLQMSSFAFAGINTIASFYFTAVGKAMESAAISASRGLVILLIAVFVLPRIFGITGVWVVSLTTETITFIFSVLFMRKNTMEEKASYAA